MRWGTVLVLGLSGTGGAAPVDYLRDVKPVLAAHCYSCHGALKQEAGLRVDTAAAILRGGTNGAVVSPGAPEESELVRRIRHEDEGERMPQESKPLSPAEIAAITGWIEAGAPAPSEEVGAADPGDHWAFQEVVRPPLPESRFGNPVDAFLDAKRAEHGLVAQPEAERPLQIRRLYLDLLGLPPTREELRDEREWEEIVDDLLERPQHGERWARHFMDVWRYSDWYGLGKQLRHSQKHLWHWRDWIVESLNADKGYDRMIHEMLAGDELAPGDMEVVRATGFLARNYYLFNRTTWLDNTIEHTSKAFLGLTMNCAKCHDHKYDPIAMTDYYRMRALFEPHQVRLDPVPGVSDFEKDGIPRVFDNHLEVPTWLHERGDPRSPDKEVVIEAGVPMLFAGFQPEITPVTLPVEAWAPGTRRHVQEERLEKARKAVGAARGLLQEAEKAEGEAGEDGPGSAPDYLIDDSFERLDAEVWEVEGADWEVRDGVLRKTLANRENNVVQSRRPHPRDFEASCRYTVTDGTTYKSVGIRFDRVDGGRNQNQVYTSAHAPDPKVQVSHTVNGGDRYPAEGKVRKAIEVGRTYELKIAVRERLLNVWLDGEFVLAYDLPERPDGGRLAISGFDAVVEFEWLRLRALPPDVTLRAGGAAPRPTRAVAEAGLAAAVAELSSVEAAVAADRARGTAEFEPLARVAVERKAEAAVARAQAEVAAAGDEKARKAAEGRLATAEKEREEARTGAGRFESFRASWKALETPEHKESQYPATWPRESTGRRTALARWMTSRENPLTARVAVNHLWMRHFGEPLVESVFDFGLRAPRPEQAELLDFLAVELIESGWSLRHLHRLMVNSRAYRLTSSMAGADAATRERDPSNRYYWRMNARRMESEVVRDSLLHLAGDLDRQVGGPSVGAGSGTKRRSLYLTHSRDDKNKFLSMFDHADHLRCYRRSESIVPQQALALSNSREALEAARNLAARLAEEDGHLDSFLVRAFETILCRAPDHEELAACREFCEALRGVTASGTPEKTVRGRLVHALLNHNDFVTIR